MYFLVEGVETTFACRNCCTHYIYSSGLVGTEFAFSTLLTIIYFLVEGGDNVRLNYLLYTFYFLVDWGASEFTCSTLQYNVIHIIFSSGSVATMFAYHTCCTTGPGLSSSLSQ